jgi:hypothetical protein
MLLEVDKNMENELLSRLQRGIHCLQIGRVQQKG